jgi:hypothetical protein
LTDRTPLDPERLVNLLGKEPGTPESKLAWLRSELPVIEGLARVDHPTDEDRFRAAIRSRVLRHYRQHQKSRPGSNGSARPATGSIAARREEANRLYTVEQLLPEPTIEALERWEAAGAPSQRAWWLPDEERRRLQVVR